MTATAFMAKPSINKISHCYQCRLVSRPNGANMVHGEKVKSEEDCKEENEVIEKNEYGEN